MVYGICALFGTYLAHSWQTKICSNILKGKNMGITVSFIFLPIERFVRLLAFLEMRRLV